MVKYLLKYFLNKKCEKKTVQKIVMILSKIMYYFTKNVQNIKRRLL